MANGSRKAEHDAAEEKMKKKKARRLLGSGGAGKAADKMKGRKKKIDSYLDSL